MCANLTTAYACASGLTLLPVFRVPCVIQADLQLHQFSDSSAQLFPVIILCFNTCLYVSPSTSHGCELTDKQRENVKATSS